MKTIFLYIIFLLTFGAVITLKAQNEVDIYLKAGIKGGMYFPDFSNFYKAYPNQSWDKKFGMTYLIDPYFELTIQEMIVLRTELNYTTMRTSTDYIRTSGKLSQEMTYTLIPLNFLVYYKLNMIDPKRKQNQVNRLKPFGGAGVGLCIINTEYKEQLKGEVDEKQTSNGSNLIFYAAVGTEYVSKVNKRFSYTFEFRYAFGGFDQPFDILGKSIEEKMNFLGPQLLLGVSYRLGAVGRGIN
jgi:hypothetical protein